MVARCRHNTWGLWSITAALPLNNLCYIHTCTCPNRRAWFPAPACPLAGNALSPGRGPFLLLIAPPPPAFLMTFLLLFPPPCLGGGLTSLTVALPPVLMMIIVRHIQYTYQHEFKRTVEMSPKTTDLRDWNLESSANRELEVVRELNLASHSSSSLRLLLLLLLLLLLWLLPHSSYIDPHTTNLNMGQQRHIAKVLLLTDLHTSNCGPLIWFDAGTHLPTYLDLLSFLSSTSSTTFIIVRSNLNATALPCIHNDQKLDESFCLSYLYMKARHLSHLLYLVEGSITFIFRLSCTLLSSLTWFLVCTTLHLLHLVHPKYERYIGIKGSKLELSWLLWLLIINRILCINPAEVQQGTFCNRYDVLTGLRGPFFPAIPFPLGGPGFFLLCCWETLMIWSSDISTISSALRFIGVGLDAMLAFDCWCWWWGWCGTTWCGRESVISR